MDRSALTRSDVMTTAHNTGMGRLGEVFIAMDNSDEFQTRCLAAVLAVVTLRPVSETLVTFESTWEEYDALTKDM